MKILLIGDIFGTMGREMIKENLEEIKTFARITGHSDIHDLNVSNLATFNSEISDYTNIKHV